MFFRRTIAKLVSAINPRFRIQSHSAGTTRQEAPEMGSAGEILRLEYEAAQAAFDQAQENPDPETDINFCVRRYLRATERLKRFLAYGEVPGDVAEKLNAESAEQVRLRGMAREDDILPRMNTNKHE